MAVFEGLAAAEVVAETTQEVGVAVFTDTAVGEDGDAIHRGLPFNVGDVEVVVEAVLVFQAHHEVVNRVNGGVHAGSDEALMGGQTWEGGGYTAVVVVVSGDGTEGDVLEVILTFTTNDYVGEFLADHAAENEAEHAFAGIALKEVGAEAEYVGGEAVLVKAVKLRAIAVTEGHRDGTGNATGGAAIDFTVVGVKLAIEAGDGGFGGGCGDALRGGAPARSWVTVVTARTVRSGRMRVVFMMKNEADG